MIPIQVGDTEMQLAGFVRKPVPSGSQKGQLLVETWQGVWEQDADSLINEAGPDVLIGEPETVELILNRMYPLPSAYLPYGHECSLSRVRKIEARRDYNKSPQEQPPVFWVFHGVYFGGTSSAPVEEVIKNAGPVVDYGTLADLKENYDPYSGYFVRKIVTYVAPSRYRNTGGWGFRPGPNDTSTTWCEVYYDETKARVVQLLGTGDRSKCETLRRDELADFVGGLASEISSSSNGFRYRGEGVNPCYARMDNCVDSLNRLLGLHAVFYGKYAYRNSSRYAKFIRRVHKTLPATLKKWDGWKEFCKWLRTEVNCAQARKLIRDEKATCTGPRFSRFQYGLDLYQPRERRKKKVAPLPDFVDDVKQCELLSAQGMLR